MFYSYLSIGIEREFIKSRRIVGGNMREDCLYGLLFVMRGGGRREEEEEEEW